MAHFMAIISRFLDASIPPEILKKLIEENEETSSSFLSAWVIWLIVALFFLILEIFTAGFAVACFSIGAVAAAIMAGLGFDIVWQLIAFSVLTFIAFITVRPLVLKHFYKTDEANRKSNADALIGRVATVTQEINHDKGTGRVAVDGDDWKAVTADGRVVSEGEKVKVKSRDSIILTVE